MVDAIISPLLELLTSMAVEEAKEQVRLVTGVGKEANKLTSNLRAIRAVLHDAEKRQVKEETVRLWLDQLRDACYDMEDVLGEWNTARLKLQIDGVDDHENDAPVPKKKLTFDYMEELKEWDIETAIKGEIMIMPRLSSLIIQFCPNLEALSDHLLQKTTLQKLIIRMGCPILEEHLTGKDWPKIRHIPYIHIR